MLSVIIATYNRSESLKDTLDSLLAQKCDGSFDYEIIIADNNSKDKTHELIEFYFPKFKGRLKYLFEPKQGKSFALNSAIKEAKGELIVFTDDDVIAEEKWLQSISECFHEYNPDAIGGKVLPLITKETPRWIKENVDLLSGPFPSHNYGKDTKVYEITTMLPFIGANMAIKKECFDKYGLFCTDMGPGQATLGDDTELFNRLRKNRKIYYCGSALAWHKVNNKRTNFKYVVKWEFALGRYYGRLEQQKLINKVKLIFGIPRYLFRKAIEDFFLLILNIPIKRKFLKTLMRLSGNIGRMYEWKILN